MNRPKKRIVYLYLGRPRTPEEIADEWNFLSRVLQGFVLVAGMVATFGVLRRWLEG